MNKRTGMLWFGSAGIIGVAFGVFYAVFGLERLPVYDRFVPERVYEAWGNGLYGSTFIGFSVLLYFVGRHAFRNGDRQLMKSLLFGVMSWLLVEAFVSLYYGIFINVAVDAVLAAVLGLPLYLGINAVRK